VSVEDKPEGGTGLKLDAIPDEHPPPAEKPPRPARERKPKSPPPKGGGSVPRVPLKV
jgi:ATP-dependent Clp protease ATP-binding subunit ClpA